MTEATELVRYFTARDGDQPIDALSLLAEDVEYHLVPLPGVELVGRSRVQLREQLIALNAPAAEHRISAAVGTDDHQFVFGERVIDGESPGYFLAVAAVDDVTRLIRRYVGAYFERPSSDRQDVEVDAGNT